MRQIVDGSSVVLATAISQIPLKIFGKQNNDIVINVGQQMHLDKDFIRLESRQCALCQAQKNISWRDVYCYAQTTIGVVVYKRESQVPPTTMTTKTSAAAGSAGISPAGAASSSTSADFLTLSSPTNTTRSSRVSTTALRPTPDSRLSVEPVAAQKIATTLAEPADTSAQVKLTKATAYAASNDIASFELHPSLAPAPHVHSFAPPEPHLHPQPLISISSPKSPSKSPSAPATVAYTTDKRQVDNV